MKTNQAPAAGEEATAKKIFAVKLPVPMHDKLDDAARKTGLGKSDLARLSLERGLDILLTQLSSEPAKVA